jgi:hypothetical protein
MEDLLLLNQRRSLEWARPEARHLRLAGMGRRLALRRPAILCASYRKCEEFRLLDSDGRKWISRVDYIEQQIATLGDLAETLDLPSECCGLCVVRSVRGSR